MVVVDNMGELPVLVVAQAITREDPLAGGVWSLGEKLKRLFGDSRGEFCCCKTFVLTFGDVEMTEDGDEAELLVVIDLLRQILRNFVGSLFSLLLSLGDKMKGFVETPVVVGVCSTAN